MLIVMESKQSVIHILSVLASCFLLKVLKITHYVFFLLLLFILSLLSQELLAFFVIISSMKCDKYAEISFSSYHHDFQSYFSFIMADLSLVPRISMSFCMSLVH